MVPATVPPLFISLLAAASAFLLVAALTGMARSIRQGTNRTVADAKITRWLQPFHPPRVLNQYWTGTHGASSMALGGLPWAAEDFAALRWVSLLMGFGLALVIALGGDGSVLSVAAALALSFAGLAGPGYWLQTRIRRRQEEVDKALPDLLDRLALGLEAGLGFEVALRRLARDAPGLLGQEVRQVVRSLDLGVRRSQALQAMARRFDSQDLQAFVIGVRQADVLGTSLAKTLRAQTELLRSARRRRAQEASRRLPILIVFPLVFFFLPALLIIYLAPPLLHLFRLP
jgi:tight adherence protein C